ncbi:DUF551 domain-containing protein [Escherichia coli]|uniref:DUF551 domain-containing protein n=1 Tax=Escherichia coli TaxID=562 RepID=UPI001366051A|nr:DUF551 domain-containing protein [Escherichia coli]MWF58215.1 DUF551 domain-containing protein [Escherichia coli]
MTINKRVSDERLSTLANLQSHECMALPAGHNEVAMMARELQQYRAAAELEVSDDELNAALTVHRLKTDGHSQLSDAFRAGYKYARRAAPQVTSETEKLVEQARAVIHCLDMCGVPAGCYADNPQLSLWGRVIEYANTPVTQVTSVPDGVARAIEKLRQDLVNCNRYNYCFEAVNQVENACRADMLAAPAVQAEQLFGNTEQVEPVSAANKLGGWIPVSERMPETMTSVLVTGTWFHHAVSFWDGASWCDLDYEPPVTHWMPLPAAPKQEAE